MLSRGFKLLTKDEHLLIKEHVAFFPSCEAISSSAIALPYMEGILEERDGGGEWWEGESGGGGGERWEGERGGEEWWEERVVEESGGRGKEMEEEW